MDWSPWQRKVQRKGSVKEKKHVDDESKKLGHFVKGVRSTFFEKNFGSSPLGFFDKFKCPE